MRKFMLNLFYQAILLHGIKQNNTEKSIVAFERGEVECHLHAQCLMIAITTTPAVFKLSIERALFEKGTRPPNLVICCRQLTGRGMHCVQGLVGYCRKSKHQPKFVEICHRFENSFFETFKLPEYKIDFQN